MRKHLAGLLLLLATGGPGCSPAGQSARRSPAPPPSATGGIVGSAQYAIDTWRPRLLVVLGTCGGLEGVARRGDIVLARRTLIYDVIERMGSADEAIAAYAVDLDTSFVPSSVRSKVREELLVSADQDIAPSEVPQLKAKFHAVAADWESGAIAYVASRNKTPVVVLKGVSDVVSPAGSETYGSMQTFEEGARRIMAQLLGLLPEITRAVR